MRGAVTLALLALAACKPAAHEAASHPGPGGPLPPFLLYQARAEAPAGDRLAVGRDGLALFSNHCGACHLIGGMGTNLLTKQRVAAGLSAEGGLIATRTDLTASYVKTVVRNGYIAMPRLSRVEVTDAELNSIAAYLSKGKP